MSGCPRCVYDVYTEDLQLYHEALTKTVRELTAQGVDKSEWPERIRRQASTLPARGGGDQQWDLEESAADRAAEEVSFEIRDLDISLRTSVALFALADNNEWLKRLLTPQVPPIREGAPEEEARRAGTEGHPRTCQPVCGTITASSLNGRVARFGGQAVLNVEPFWVVLSRRRVTVPLEPRV